jgi:hypothetical protein
MCQHTLTRAHDAQVAFGVEKAKWICVGTIDVTQVCAPAYTHVDARVRICMPLPPPQCPPSQRLTIFFTPQNTTPTHTHTHTPSAGRGGVPGGNRRDHLRRGPPGAHPAPGAYLMCMHASMYVCMYACMYVCMRARTAPQPPHRCLVAHLVRRRLATYGGALTHRLLVRGVVYRSSSSSSTSSRTPSSTTSSTRWASTMCCMFWDLSCVCACVFVVGCSQRMAYNKRIPTRMSDNSMTG